MTFWYYVLAVKIAIVNILCFVNCCKLSTLVKFRMEIVYVECFYL